MKLRRETVRAVRGRLPAGTSRFLASRQLPIDVDPEFAVTCAVLRIATLFEKYKHAKPRHTIGWSDVIWKQGPAHMAPQVPVVMRRFGWDYDFANGVITANRAEGCRTLRLAWDGNKVLKAWARRAILDVLWRAEPRIWGSKARIRDDFLRKGWSCRPRSTAAAGSRWRWRTASSANTLRAHTS